MSTRLVTGIISLCLVILAGDLANTSVIRMIGEINRKRWRVLRIEDQLECCASNLNIEFQVKMMMSDRTLHFCSFLILAAINLSCSRTLKPESAVVAPEQPLVIRTTQSPTDGDSREPDLYATHDGRVILSWVEKVTDKRYALRFAMLDGNGWSEARTVSQGENWFINWADFPSLIALRNGTLAAHWLAKSGSATYAYDVNISQSKVEGMNWTKPIVPHRDDTLTEHGFVSER